MRRSLTKRSTSPRTLCSLLVLISPWLLGGLTGEVIDSRMLKVLDRCQALLLHSMLRVLALSVAPWEATAYSEVGTAFPRS